MLTLTSRKKLPRFQNVIDQVRLFNLRIQIQMQCQFHLIEDLSKATAYFPIHGFRYPYPLHHRLLGRLFVLFSRWHQHQCFLFVFLFCILVLFLFFFFSCSVVRRSCLVFAPLVDLILVTGFLFWQPLVVFWVSGWIFIFISNYVSVTINSAILWPQVFTYINCCLGSQPRGFDKRFILDSYRDNMNLWNASRPAITKIYSKIFMWN